MHVQSFIRTVRIARPASEVFAWHERPGALARLTPPWEQVEILKHEGIGNGARAALRTKAAGRWFDWEVEHRDFVEGKRFRDVQISGPFAAWEHLHSVEPDGNDASVLRDEIRYRLPGGALGRTLAGGWVKRRLERLFDYRHAVTRGDVEMRKRYGAVRKMTILVAGSSGFVGTALRTFLTAEGHDVVRLVRRAAAGPDEISWNPAAGGLDPHALRGIDVVVNLAGENVAGGRWTPARRDQIWSSRVATTQMLVDTVEKMRHRPFAWINASAVGIYGDRGDEKLDEGSERGAGFLADVCDAWEHEAEAADGLGVRTALLRFGVVLSPAGGALAKMLPVFRAGLGGRLGGGKQWMSWIGLDDAVGAIHHAILNQSCAGPINATAPNPVTNAEFAATLGRVLGRPAAVPAPAWALRAAFGAMADAALLGSARVLPRRLEEDGFYFRHEKLEEVLRYGLGRRASPQANAALKADA